MSLRERAAVLAESLGPAGAAGLGLLGAALVLAVVAVPPALDALAVAESRHERALARPAREARAGRAEDASPQARIAAFVAHFPAAGASAAEVVRLLDIAARHGLRLDSGDYRYAIEAGSGLARYQIAFPVQGGYPAARAFVTEALAAVPALALDALSLKREGAQSTAVEGRVQFSLYVRVGG